MAATWRPDDDDGLSLNVHPIVDDEQQQQFADDPMTQLNVAKGKIKELDAQAQLHKQELERLQKLCLELLEERASSSPQALIDTGGTDSKVNTGKKNEQQQQQQQQQQQPRFESTEDDKREAESDDASRSHEEDVAGSDLNDVASCHRQIDHLSGLVQALREERDRLVQQHQLNKQTEVGSPSDDDNEQTAELNVLRTRLQEVESRLQDQVERPHPDRPTSVDDDEDRRATVGDGHCESEVESSEVAFWKAKCDQLSRQALEAEKLHDVLLKQRPEDGAEFAALGGGLDELQKEKKEKMETIKHLTSEAEGSNVTMAANDQSEEIVRLQDHVTTLQQDKESLNEQLERLKSDRERDNRTDDKKELETLQRSLQVLEDEVTALGAEKESLAASLEELDAQHQMAIGQLLASREDLQKRCSDLQESLRHQTSDPDALLNHLLNHVKENPNALRDNVDLMKTFQLVAELIGSSDSVIDELQETLHQRDVTLEALIQQLAFGQEREQHNEVEFSQQQASLLEAQEALETKVRQLEEFLVDRERQISALNDILRVYKENFDPDQQTGSDAHEAEVLQLRTTIQKLETERDSVMSALNEKTNENCSLQEEVHRLANVAKAPASEVESADMSKEALKNLARLVRDREVEIEALKQKNETLVSIVKNSGEAVAAPLSTEKLVDERNELKTAIGHHQREREQLVAALNQKHGESVAYYAEIQRLSGVIEDMRTGHQQLAHQYEIVEKQLVDARNEILVVRQQAERKLTSPSTPITSSSEIQERADVEVTKEDLDVHEHQQQQQQQQQNEVERLNRALQDKDKLLYEKDRQVHEKMRQLQGIGEQLRRKDEQLTDAGQHSEKLAKQLDGCHRDIDALRGSNDNLRSRMQELRSSVATLKEANSMLNVTLQEREFELKALREKEDTLSRMVMKNEPDDDQDIRRLLSESEQMRQSAQGFQAERDQAILALAQKQREADELREQIKGPCKERESRLLRELERLRDHLLHVEDSYTQEALRAEDREKELRTRLARAEDRVHTASSSHSTATHQASLQAESLQEQLRAVVEQRDEVLLALSTVEDQLAQKATALHTLQVVLEQLQQERQRDLTAVQARHQAQIGIERNKNEELQREIHFLMERQKETTEALSAASRLTEQLDRKEDTIRILRQEVGIRDAEIEKTKQEIVRINSSSEVTVDRTIVKNLVVGLLTVPSSQHKEVLRVIATILDFNKEERERTGLDQDVRSKTVKSPTSAGWMSGWLSNKRSEVSSSGGGGGQPPNQSLTEAFVRFLERESQPARPMITSRPAPAVEPASDSAARQSRVARTNPFNYPTMADSPHRTSMAAMGSSHLLLKPMSTALPTFAPSVSVVAATSDNASFLREALQNQ